MGGRGRLGTKGAQEREQGGKMLTIARHDDVAVVGQVINALVLHLGEAAAPGVDLRLKGGLRHRDTARSITDVPHRQIDLARAGSGEGGEVLQRGSKRSARRKGKEERWNAENGRRWGSKYTEQLSPQMSDDTLQFSLLAVAQPPR